MLIPRCVCVTGQAVSASSHSRGAWAGEGGRDRPGAAGSPSVKAHAAVGHLTTQRPTGGHQTDPAWRHQGAETLLLPRVRTRWSAVLCCFCLTEIGDRRKEKPSVLLIWCQPAQFVSITFLLPSSSPWPAPACTRGCVRMSVFELTVSD